MTFGFNEILTHDYQRSRVRFSIIGMVLKPLQKHHVADGQRISTALMGGGGGFWTWDPSG